MCTAISFKGKHHYFGRNLDIDIDYGEKIVITPRNFPLPFRFADEKKSHFALAGAAVVIDSYPLYFDAFNEKGLCIAGLNFPKNAVYYLLSDEKINITPFELIPYLLSDCESVADAYAALQKINIADVPFSCDLKLSPLHWIVSDCNESITLETTENGMHIYKNDAGILTNNPEFPSQMASLAFYSHLTPKKTDSNEFYGIKLPPSSLGCGAVGLPGDFTSPSRFIKAFFVKQSNRFFENETNEIPMFFDMLGSVSIPKGCMLTADGKSEFTRYSCCCDTETDIYYYKTHNSCRVAAVSLKNEKLDGKALVLYDMISESDIKFQN